MEKSANCIDVDLFSTKRSVASVGTCCPIFEPDTEKPDARPGETEAFDSLRVHHVGEVSAALGHPGAEACDPSLRALVPACH